MSDPAPKEASAAGIVLFQLCLLAVAYFAIKWVGIEVSVETGEVLIDALLGLVVGFATYGLMWYVARPTTAIGRNLRDTAQSLRSGIASFGMVAIVAVAAAAAVSEEFLFRVFLQTWISGSTAPWIGVVVSSLVFGAMHALSVAYFVMSLSIGIMIGAAYAWNGSIVMIICWHFAYDLMSFLVIVKRPDLLGLE